MRGRLSIASSFFWLFSMWGVVLPYMTPVLLHMGYAKHEAGLLSGVFALFSALVPTFTGRLGDGALTVDRLLRLCLGLLAAFAGLLWLCRDAPSVVFIAVLLGFSAARAPLVSLHDTLAMLEVADAPAAYARLRLVGSVGFMVSSMVVALYLADGHLERFFPALLIVCCAALGASFFLPKDRRPRRTAAEKGFRRSLDRPFFLWLLAAALHWFCFGPYHYGFTLLLGEAGVPERLTGVMWSVAVVAEIVVFFNAGWFFARLTYRQVLFVALGSSLARWTLLGFFPHPAVIAATQLLHGTSFALFWSAAMQGLARFHGGRYQASYQGLFATAVAGAGGVLGMGTAGWLHGHMPFAEVIRCIVPVQAAALLVLWRNPLVRPQTR